MNRTISSLKQSFPQWLESEIATHHINEWTEITLPFLDRHNDYIGVYAKAQDGGILLTDGGETLTDLDMCGINVEALKEKSFFKGTLRRFSVKEKDDELYIKIDSGEGQDEINWRLKCLVQAIVVVSNCSE